MSGSQKRSWGARLTFDEAQQQIFNFLNRCREKNILTEEEPKLYQAWRLPGDYPVQSMTGLSSYLKFGYTDNPKLDEDRNQVIRLLSVALKAHFFLEPENAIVIHEPYVWHVPDLFKPGHLSLGLLYTLEVKGQKVNWIVFSGDLSFIASSLPKLKPNDRFPVVLSKNSYQWIETKKWRALKDSAKGLPWFEWSTWPIRKKAIETIHAHQDISTFSYGTIIESSQYSRSEDLQILGAEWARGIKRWYWPQGWDLTSTQEYLAHINTLTDEERYELKWWQKTAYPVRDVKKSS